MGNVQELLLASYPITRKGVLEICSKFKGEHPCWSVISMKWQSNFTEITFRHGYSPVNLLHIFRVSFLYNTSGDLLLLLHLINLVFEISANGICRWRILVIHANSKKYFFSWAMIRLRRQHNSNTNLRYEILVSLNSSFFIHFEHLASFYKPSKNQSFLIFSGVT